MEIVIKFVESKRKKKSQIFLINAPHGKIQHLRVGLLVYLVQLMQNYSTNVNGTCSICFCTCDKKIYYKFQKEQKVPRCCTCTHVLCCFLFCKHVFTVVFESHYNDYEC